MKLQDIAKQLSNRINQEHYVMHYLKKIQRTAYDKGVKDNEKEMLNKIDENTVKLKIINGLAKRDHIINNINDKLLSDFKDILTELYKTK